ncbi:arylesterase [Halodesulfovibrio marinisediminis]|uniref:Lysophospholipase L1 n=1 Tax=Halodesulfovibrio marinisediminis DSM 17456 TaxID=1121457 RepID=A0A1N6FNZ3_9BACT|nr:arylesterase [Halodesulfovibrio marinisediminis]SIN97027.1 Lysophospholipase L1 [Halodesulfovibrio marinisediminis DSM 17456]
MRHGGLMRCGRIYAGVILLFLFIMCSLGNCAQQASQLVAVAVQAKASPLHLRGTTYTPLPAQPVIYPRTSLAYYTPEAQNITFPPGKVFFISAFGDSLISGYGLDNAMNSFPVVLQETLRELGYPVVVDNDGIAGNTTAQGHARLPKILLTRPDIIILELGANDMLQRRSVPRMKANLAAMIREIQDLNIHLLLTGMYSVPHFGQKYADSFDAVFPDLAAKYNVAFYPFFLEGVALDHSLNQEDGYHPNADGVKVIVGNILPYIVKQIELICTQQL